MHRQAEKDAPIPSVTLARDGALRPTRYLGWPDFNQTTLT